MPYYTTLHTTGLSVFWPFGKVTFTYVARGIKELKAPRSGKPEAGVLLKDTFRRDENETGYIFFIVYLPSHITRSYKWI